MVVLIGAEVLACGAKVTLLNTEKGGKGATECETKTQDPGPRTQDQDSGPRTRTQDQLHLIGLAGVLEDDCGRGSCDVGGRHGKKTLHSTIHPNVDALTRRFDWALQRGAKLSFLAASWCERLTGAMFIFDLLIFVFLSADE